MRSFLTIKLALLGALTFAVTGCPDVPEAPDARIKPPDAGPPDAPEPTIDAEPMIDADMTPDAMVDTFSGTVSIQEVTVQNLQGMLGQGLQINTSFIKNGKAPSLVEGSLADGCMVWEYTPAELAAEVSQNEGTLTLTAADGTPFSMATATGTRCLHVGTGYRCFNHVGPGGPANMGATTVLDDAQAMGMLPANTAAYTVVGATFDAATDTGTYLNISGLADAANNGTFPIVAVQNATTVVVGNPAAVTNLTAATATYMVVVGAGPNPGVPESNMGMQLPGLLEDDDMLTIALDTTGGTGDWTSFSVTMDPGDDVQLNMASVGLITNLGGGTGIPVDGSSFTIDCMGGGGSCGNALGTILTITTTDGDVTGLPPYVMPPPVAKQVSIRCTKIGQSNMTISAAASAFLASSGATRIQTTYLRDNLQQPPAGKPTNVVAGHGVVGFTTP